MSSEIKTKETFGGNDYAIMRPALPDGAPPKLNIVLGFDDALKLQFSLNQALAQLNKYKRSTTAGKRSAVILCIHRDLNRMTVLEGKLPREQSE